MASSFVNEFNPPRRPELKRQIPSALLDFKKNLASTRRLLRPNESDQTFQFENVMQKRSSSSLDGKIVVGKENELGTENGNILTTETGDIIVA
jgi:hypothetical protein